MGRPAPHRELSAFETLMVAGEDDPRTRSSFVVAFVLDNEPDFGALNASFEYLSRRVVRFRQRAVLPALAVGTGRWAVDPDFDLGYHLRVARLPAPGTFRSALDAVEVLLMTPLDRGRPLWEAHLLTGLQGGGAVALLKFHHAMFDGLGGLEATAHLFQTERTGQNPALPPLPGPQDLDGARVALEELRRLPFDLAGVLTRASRDLAGGLWRAAQAPSRAPRWGPALRAWNQALSELVTAGPSDASPLLERRSPARRVLTLDVDVDDLKRAGKTAGGSLNDAYLAAVSSAVGAYHARLGVPVEHFLLAIPISLRTEADPEISNRWAPARLLAPAGPEGPVERITHIHELMAAARQRAALDAVGRVSPLVTFVPRWALPLLAGRATGIDLQVSNVPGWSGGDLYLAGAKVLSAHPFGPLPGSAAMITLLSINGTCHIGVNYDPAAITDPTTFANCLGEGFEEMRKLAAERRAPAGAASHRKTGRRSAP